ncbi:MAG TPA: hypothetical protein VMY41_01395, partial [Thermohalobaculum sp.]|nr:hypothetical protein [Thermohalobaculum sp.]
SFGLDSTRKPTMVLVTSAQQRPKKMAPHRARALAAEKTSRRAVFKGIRDSSDASAIDANRAL